MHALSGCPPSPVQAKARLKLALKIDELERAERVKHAHGSWVGGWAWLGARVVSWVMGGWLGLAAGVWSHAS